MNSSIFRLQEACNAVEHDGTDLIYASYNIGKIGKKLTGVNSELEQACYTAERVLEELNLAIAEIIKNIKNTINTFAENTKDNENQTYNSIDAINEMSNQLLKELQNKQ